MQEYGPGLATNVVRAWVVVLVALVRVERLKSVGKGRLEWPHILEVVEGRLGGAEDCRSLASDGFHRIKSFAILVSSSWSSGTGNISRVPCSTLFNIPLVKH